MTKTKSFFRHLSLLNIGLVLFLTMFFSSLISPGLRTVFHYELPHVKRSMSSTEKHFTDLQPPAISNYVSISENNVFHPDRKIPMPSEKKAEAELPALPKPDVILYGTLITDDTSVAYLEDLKSPYNTRGRGRRQLVLRKGDTLSGFTLQEVDVDRIVMARGQEKIIIKIHEKRRPSDQELKRTEKPVAPSQIQPTAKPQQPQPDKQPKKQLRGFEQDVFDFLKKGK
jgi:hypothetical protein